MRINPFVRCFCGKLHIIAVSFFPMQFCPRCGRNLWDVVQGVDRR